MVQMSSVGAKVTMHINEAVLKVEDASEAALAALAFQIEAQTKANIQANGQIDTGFMLNSVYSLARAQHTGATTHDSTWKSGKYTNKAGDSVSRKRAPRRTLGEATAAVAVGANYAIFQEEKNSFLFKAARAVASQAKAILEPVYRSKI